ncbi:MAG: hypothetical protein IKO27_02695 [Ruminococcus sp.]|nr:hypothetical protein [Ruminococcus sp.]
MGLFSKLFGKEISDAAKDMFGEEKHYFDNLSQHDAPQPVPTAAQERAQRKLGPSGNSWGAVMPEEENQFSFGGNYVQYFQKVFAEEFPAYQVVTEPVPNRSATTFTFTSGGRDLLVVEVMSDTSVAVTIRNRCLSEGVPYLRFYHNHNGWWNTRSYVAGRVRSALGV